MKDLWRITIEKAGQNLDAADLLYEKNLYGLSAYHMQQTMELSIKACAYRLGFLQYINKIPPLYDHNPSKILLPVVYDYLTESMEELTASHMDNKIKNGINETLDLFRLLRKTLHDTKDNSQLKEKIWMISLNMPIQDEKLQSLHNSIKDYCNNRMTIFLDDVTYYAQNIISKGIHILEKARQKPTIYYTIKNIEENFVKHDLPKGLVKSIVNRDENGWKNELTQLIKQKGVNETLDLIFAPNGLLSMLDHPNLKSNVDTRWSVKDRLKVMWITYISTISPLALFIYPHEVFGRYPEARDDFDTEKLYLEHKNDLKKIMEQCRSIYCRINKMLSLYVE